MICCPICLGEPILQGPGEKWSHCRCGQLRTDRFGLWAFETPDWTDLYLKPNGKLYRNPQTKAEQERAMDVGLYLVNDREQPVRIISVPEQEREELVTAAIEESLAESVLQS